MVAKLDRIIARCGVPLEKLISDLEANITNLILKTQVSVKNILSLLLNDFIMIILMDYMLINMILLSIFFTYVQLHFLEGKIFGGHCVKLILYYYK